MKDIQHIAEDLRSSFAPDRCPQEFLDEYDQMECLASHRGRETFLVRRKEDGCLAVAKCYDRSVFPFQPSPDPLTGIEHPGLPRLLGQYQDGQTLCVVRDYLEGETLVDYLREKQPTLPEIVEIGQRLCDILSVLHGHTPPIIHRDIKPENIIIRPDGTPALIDFDISRTYKDRSGSDTVFLGTQGYASPEQYGFRQTDARADIYALGVLLRYMVTGISRENPHVSIHPAMQKVIGRCTAFSPEERYASVSEVRRDLEKARKPASPLSVRSLAGGLILLLAALCCGFLIGRFSGWLKPVPSLSFSEPLIEQAVRTQLGGRTGPLTADDLAQVQKIYIFGSRTFADYDSFSRQSVADHAKGPLRTLDDLALLPGLEEIHIHCQKYLDVSAVSDLAHLHTVDLKHLRLSGLEPIAHLAQLRHAILFDCGLYSLTPLQNCPWLETLDIGLNNLTELQQIGFHPSVNALGLMWLNMDSLEGIARQMPKLQAVTLQHGSFRDLSGLLELSSLRAVYVLQDQLEEVSALFAGTGVEIHVTEN